jgi:hypothetical protein
VSHGSSSRSRLRLALELTCVPWGSTGYGPLKQTSIPWQCDRHDLHEDVRLSFKALRDKGGATRLQGVQQTAH